jgi:tRNA dimethylallyltransferase
MQRSAHELWEELRTIDPAAAEKTHENNKKRVVRALEIYYKTGKTKTETDREQKKYQSDFDYLLLQTDSRDRKALYDKIDRRVDMMIQNGLVKETETLLENKDLREGTTAYQAIGYKELFPYINGEKSLDECVEKLKQATRNYAKRQITWFSRYDSVRVSDYGDAEAAVSAFLKGVDGNG